MDKCAILLLRRSGHSGSTAFVMPTTVDRMLFLFGCVCCIVGLIAWLDQEPPRRSWQQLRGPLAFVVVGLVLMGVALWVFPT